MMKTRLWLALALIAWCGVARGALDNFANFSIATVSAPYGAAATSVVMGTGGAARMPTVPFNAVWWNATDYGDPADDPNREIVRVTNVASETLTVARAQEGTAATTKNTAGKTYRIMATLTAKTLNTDIPGLLAGGAYVLKAGDSMTGSLTGPAAVFTNGVTTATAVLSGTTPSWDWAGVRCQTITLSGNTTVTIQNPPTTGRNTFTLWVVGDGTRTLALSGVSVQWPLGAPPSAMPAVTNILDFEVLGSTVNGFYSTVAGITTLNTLTAATQTFATGTSGADFGISSATSTHTFNLPTASGSNRGALSTTDWTTFNGKAPGSFAATQRVFGRNTAGAGVGEEVTATQLTDWIGSTRGSVLYRGASAWAILAPGTSGHVLTSNGAGSDPTYQVAGGGSSLFRAWNTSGSVGKTNSTAETTAFTCTVTGGTLSTNKVLDFQVPVQWLNNSGGSANLTVKVKYGATTVINDAIALGASVNFRSLMIRGVLGAAAATGAQRAQVEVTASNSATTGNEYGAMSGFVSSGGRGGAASEDSTANKTFSVTLTMDVANANTYWLTELGSLKE
jgi:hypothetical protein